ncbi:MAG TPA: 4Fe-4S binding protein [Prolixibacteraceae bacterium]|nr:4Fe-4S binding protein [Bacteroidales bacterium]HPB06164.1 4Fe-4S binding protein [Prolixibacteraceae bacterium]HQN93468.1 4Fe-4S binding protein [Prolixibacteraceae bacterium]HUM88329.1 4Fe-4S binding protein [Prolixibacteraceae bacterium]
MNIVKRRIILRFPPQSGDKPLSYVLVKDYDIRINILKAEVMPGKRGSLLLEMEARQSNLDKGIAYLEAHNVECQPLDKRIQFNSDKCISCGNCTAVCFAGALTMNQVTWKMEFNKELCVACELCVKACPLRLFDIDFRDGN